MGVKWFCLFWLALLVPWLSYSEPENIAWEPVLQEGPWHEPGEPVVVAFDGNLWLLGGISSSSVWRSENGKDWSCVQPAAPWFPRDSHCAFAFGDSLWVHGGGLAFLMGDVWRSDRRGIEWKRVLRCSKCLNEQFMDWHRISGTAGAETTATEIPWKPRCRHSITIHNGMVYMAGGLVARAGLKENGVEVVVPFDATNDVWRSQDGEHWECVTERASWEARNGFGFFSLGGKLWVAGGAIGKSEESSYSDEIWSSVDGRQWTLAGRLPCGPRSNFGICGTGQGIYLLGGYTGIGTKINDVWFSSDATTWKDVGTLPNAMPRWRPGVCWFRDQLWLIGGTTGNGRQQFSDVWVGTRAHD